MDFSLIETLRWEPGTGFVRLERHLGRLARSAAAVGLPGAEGARSALLAAVPPSALPGLPVQQTTPATAPTTKQGNEPSPSISPLEEEMPGRAEAGESHPTPLRIRLELFPGGRIEVQAAPFTPLDPETTWRLKLAATRLASTDALLRHKTSRRAAYVAARAEFPAAEADEILLLNERGDICEGTITSLFLDDGTGLLKTPPLACGLLAGVLREELLETGKAVEQVLRPEDFARGTIWMGNSLRGLIRSALA